MELTVEQNGSITRVAPKGRIDSNTARLFGEQVSTLIASGRNRLVIDFRDVPYISSAGFRHLLIADELIQSSQGVLALCGMAAEIQRLFDIGMFTENFEIFPSFEDSVAHLRSR